MLRYSIFGLAACLLMATSAWGELKHQYTFSDGTANDSVGGKHGTIVNPAGVNTQIGGQLDMRSNATFFSNQEGGTGDFTRFVNGVYVDLPNFMISELTLANGGIASFEAWVTVETNRTWARIFDLGTSNMGEDTAVSGDASDYIFLTPQNGGTNVEFTTRASTTQANGFAVSGPTPQVGVQHHYVAVIDQTDTTADINGTLYTYVDGRLTGTGPVANGYFIYSFADDNNWLGRSQWNDPLLTGTFNEFRIYDHALSAQEVAMSFETGPQNVNPRFIINRDDQSITLVSRGLDGDLAGYSLTSAFGALDVDAWTPISGRLDSGGDSSFDDAAWSIDASMVGQLAESADTGTGGGLTSATSISLGDIWLASPVEDIVGRVQLADGSVVGAEVVYEGNDGARFLRSDLNFDGVVDANDWTVFVSGLFGDFSGLSPAQAYGMGDLNGDLRSDVRDFQIFRADFIAAQGAAAFAALASGVNIPEPSTVVLACVLVFCAAAVGRRTLAKNVQAAMPGRRILSLLLALCAVAVFTSSTSAQMIHRWSFNEEGGTTIMDSIGDAHAELVGDGGFLAGGQVTLPGGPSATAPYVDLPNGIISRLTNATFEGWATIDGAQSWGRLFDFGSTAGGELFEPGGGGEGQDYFMLSASRGTNITESRLEFRNLDPAFGGDEAGNVVGGTQLLDVNNIPNMLGEEFHFAVVFDADAGQMHQYRNGRLLGSANVTFRLGNLNDVNNWLGRSNWTNDANFQGSFNEFRIYDAALDDFDIGTSFVGGPDVGPEGPPVLELEVDTDTGNVVLHNRQDTAIDFNFYQVTSSGGALNVGGWTSLDSQGIDSMGAGPGESWDAGGGSSQFLFGEAYLLGMSVLAPGASVDLGTAFNPSVFGPGQDGDLQFRYLRADGLGLIGKVSYMGEGVVVGIPGDYNNSGQVEQADLDLVLLNWGQPTPPIPDGWTNDPPIGAIDQEELDKVLLNWGNTAALGTSPVPEPSTALTLVVFLSLAFARAVWRKRG